MQQLARINFFSRRKRLVWPEVFSGDTPDPNELPGLIKDGIDAWIIQPYLLLTSSAPRDWIVTISDEICPKSINVVHRDELHLENGLARGFIVCVRADRPPVTMADIVVCQNREFASETDCLFLPHFPQPGLIPRAPSRLQKLKNLDYFGRSKNLSSLLSGSGLEGELSDFGVEFNIREKEWHNYRDTDAVLAIRALSSNTTVTKPATKLVNAWLAGTPALLGPEPAYRELRESEYDYIEVGSKAELLEGIHRLQDPGEYVRFQEQGKKRAKEFSRDMTMKSWIDVFDSYIIPRWELWKTQSHLGRPYKLLGQCLHQHILTKKWKLQGRLKKLSCRCSW